MSTISLIEGFDFVGKSAYLNEKTSVNSVNYRAGYEILDTVTGRDKSFVFGYSQFELFNKAQLNLEKDLNYDRSIASSWVYARLYDTAYKVDGEVLNNYLKNIKEQPNYVQFVHISHYSKDSAKRIYDADTSHNDFLDKFDSFEDYWKTYLLAEELYDEFYSSYGKSIDLVWYHSLSNEEGTSVKLLKNTL